MMKSLTIRLRTRHDLGKLLERGESPAWVVARSKESRIATVEVINFEGSHMIVGTFDPVRSHRWDNGRLVVAFKDAKLIECDVPYACPASVRYFEEAG